jgi:hypothetical protein
MPKAMIQPDHRNLGSESGEQMNSSRPLTRISPQRGAATAIELTL